MAEGVDDATTCHHRRAGDYAAWARDAIKDDELAAEFAGVERQPDIDPRVSRGHIKKAIDRLYTGPASGESPSRRSGV